MRKHAGKEALSSVPNSAHSLSVVLPRRGLVVGGDAVRRGKQDRCSFIWRRWSFRIAKVVPMLGIASWVELIVEGLEENGSNNAFAVMVEDWI